MESKKENKEKEFCIMDCENNQEDCDIEVYTMEELLEASEKSQKFIKPFSIEDYLEDMKKTVLTMSLTSEICKCIKKEATKVGLDQNAIKNICDTIEESVEEEYTEETMNQLKDIRKKINEENIEEIIKQIYCILNNNHY